jgi:hypothetical protein
MPIRKRISDPYSDDVKRVEKRMREGAPPPCPKKPDAATREPFVKALKAVPVGEEFDRQTFFRRIVDNYLITKYEIWGQSLFIMPGYLSIDERFVRCTGCTVARINPNKRGVKPRLNLRGEPRTWYTQVLRWIEETEYDG